MNDIFLNSDVGKPNLAGMSISEGKEPLSEKKVVLIFGVLLIIFGIVLIGTSIFSML